MAFQIKARTLLAAFLLAVVAAPRPAHAGPTLLFDPQSGKVLYAEDQDDEWHPASLTKIMTAYLTFEAIKDGRLALDQKITCSELAFKQDPSKVGLPVGAEMTVEIALQALIVKSANDVAMMLAEAVAGSDTAFVAQMNNTAKRLGMTRTTFANPNGLPASQQVTTARDLAILARAVLNDYPQYNQLWGMSEMRFGKIRLTSHNGLLRSFAGADGMKTGFICDSGFNVVASATRDGQRLMAVVLGENSGADRTVRAAALLEHGFQNIGWKSIFDSTQTLETLPVASDARAIASMRQNVISWECGRRRPPKTVKLTKPKTVSARIAKAKAQAAKAKAGASVAVPAAATTEAAPAPAAAETPAPQEQKPQAVEQAPAQNDGEGANVRRKPVNQE